MGWSALAHVAYAVTDYHYIFWLPGSEQDWRKIQLKKWYDSDSVFGTFVVLTGNTTS
jgi:hypothetical protein